MATDPTVLISQLVNAGGNIAQQYAAGQEQGEQQISASQQAQAGALQLAAVRQQAQRDTQLQSDLADFTAAPADQKAAKLGTLMMAYPDHAAAYKSAYDTMTAPQRDSHAQNLYELYSAAKNGKGQIVADKIKQIAQAEGNSDPDLKSLQTDLASNNPDALNNVLSYAQGHLAFAAPDKAKALGLITEPYSLSEGQTRFGADNQPIASVAAKKAEPHYEKIDVLDKYGTKIGERVVQVGGDQATAGSAPSAGATAAGTGSPSDPLSTRLNNPGAIRSCPIWPIRTRRPARSPTSIAGWRTLRAKRGWPAVDRRQPLRNACGATSALSCSSRPQENTATPLPTPKRSAPSKGACSRPALPPQRSRVTGSVIPAWAIISFLRGWFAPALPVADFAATLLKRPTERHWVQVQRSLIGRKATIGSAIAAQPANDVQPLHAMLVHALARSPQAAGAQNVDDRGQVPPQEQRHPEAVH